jgi:hypothetical protein
MKISVVKLVMPVAAFVLASAGAVSTSGVNASKSTVAAVQGWERVSPEQCSQLRMCNNIPNTICSLSGTQAFAKVGNDCVEVLYHKN